MAHNLATTNGRIAMAYQGETPWHNLGTRIDAAIAASVDRSMDAAGINFTVDTEALYLRNGTPVPNRRAIVRTDDGRVLGTCTDSYSTIQNVEAFAPFQPIIDEFNLTIESAGALGDGERVWMLFRMKDADVSPVQGDDVRGYAVAITGHDGHTTYELRPTPIRVVCQNTLNAAVGAGGRKGRVFGIPHTSQAGKRVDEVSALVRDVMRAMQETGETFSAMASKRMTSEDVIAFVERVFPMTTATKSGEISKALAERRATVADLVFTGVGSDLARQDTDGAPNLWACYNAVTEYFDHVLTGAAKSDAGKVRANESAIFGTAADFKLSALTVARELAYA